MRCFSADFKFDLFMHAATDKYSNTGISTDIVDDTWTHVTAIWPGTSGLVVYYDGNLEGSGGWTDYTVTDKTANTNRYVIIGHLNSGQSNTNVYVTLDELKIYNAVFDAAAVLTLYNSY